MQILIGDLWIKTYGHSWMTMKKVNVSTKAIANVMLGVKENPAIHRQSNTYIKVDALSWAFAEISKFLINGST